MALTQLDVVNECIGVLGEAPLTSIDYAHPFVARALAKLQLAEMEAQAKWWWWNTRIVTLEPDETGLVTLPDHACEFFTSDFEEPVGLLEGILTNLHSGEVITRPIKGTLIFTFPLEHAAVPHLGQLYIRALAVHYFQAEYDADSPKRSLIEGQVTRGFAQLNAQHIRLTRSNILERSSTLVNRMFVRTTRPYTR